MTNPVRGPNESYDQCVYALVMEGDRVDSIWDNYENLRDYWLFNGGKKVTEKMKNIVVLTKEEWDDLNNQGDKKLT